MMRCTRWDESSITMTLHYLMNGALRLRLVVSKQEFLIPLSLVLKALQPLASDRSIYVDLADEPWRSDARGVAIEGVANKYTLYVSASLSVGVSGDDACVKNAAMCYLARLGHVFRHALRMSVGESGDAALLGRHIISNYIAVHVSTFECKFAVLQHMATKLDAFVHGRCCADNMDALCHHELLLPGCILARYLKEKMEETLVQIIAHVRHQHSMSKLEIGGIFDGFTKLVDRYGGGIGSKVEALLASGNMVSSSGLDLQQTSGFAIVADRLNRWRYLSHFQAVHRGQFFTKMKTTDVRKLVPEAWGFVCPVHTPDGAPCGLLSHLSSGVVVAHPTVTRHDRLMNWLVSLGVAPWMKTSDAVCVVSCRAKVRLSFSDVGWTPVVLDGAVVGLASHSCCEILSELLRYLRCTSSELWPVDNSLEVALIRSGAGGTSPFSSLYIFSHTSRLLRPVFHRNSDNLLAYVGPLEQSTLRVVGTLDMNAHTLQDSFNTSWLCSGQVEVSESYILSTLASCTPFSEYNQSPRNMYQCQMGKQTMGTPCHGWKYRCENKLYRLTTPQSPIVRTQSYDSIGLDAFAQGVNSVVAVVSYTGYDMEDAMILNLSSYQRGYSHGSVYKTVAVDLHAEAKKIESGQGEILLQFDHESEEIWDEVNNTDNKAHSVAHPGLPDVGQMVCSGDVLWSAHGDCFQHVTSNYHEAEPAFVEAIRSVG